MTTLFDAEMIGGSATLTDRDISDFHEAVQRVYDLMKDGAWYSPDQIELAAGKDGIPAREGLRRMRQLRKLFTIEKARDDLSSRLWLYRLIPR